MFEQFLKSINAPDEIIENLKRPDITEDEVNNFVKRYSDDRKAFYETAILAEKKKSIEDNAIENFSNIRVKKMINELAGLGYTNSQIKDLSLDDFFNVAKREHEKRINDLSTNVDENIKQELDKYKKSSSTYKTEYEKLQEQIETFKTQKDAELQDHIRRYEAERFISTLIEKDDKIANVPGRAYSLEKIKEDILTKYQIDKGGAIRNLDGTIALHPEKEIVMNSAVDLYEYLKNKAGLVPVSNGGSGTTNYQTTGGVVTTGPVNNKGLQKMQELAAVRRGSLVG